jgi:hypothetical protein
LNIRRAQLAGTRLAVAPILDTCLTFALLRTCCRDRPASILGDRVGGVKHAAIGARLVVPAANFHGRAWRESRPQALNSTRKESK